MTTLPRRPLTLVHRRHALAAALLVVFPAAIGAQDPALQPQGPQCPPETAVTCPARREVTAVAGWAPESYSVGIAWTSVRRLGAYVRIFPGLDPAPRSVPNSTVTAESQLEYGLAYRLTAPLTIGVGFGKYTRTDTEYGGIDPVTFRPSLVGRERSSESGPALFVAWALHPPNRAIGLALSGSVGVVGSGVAVGTTLRFPRVRAPIGIP